MWTTWLPRTAACRLNGLALWMLLGVGLADAAAPPPRRALTPEQRARLEERERLLKEADSLYGAGKLEETIVALEKVLALERGVFGDVHELVAQSLSLLARLHEGREDYAAAVRVAKEALAVRTKLHERGHWREIDARLDLEELEGRVRMGIAQRRQLARAQGLNLQVFRLWQKGKSRDALPLAKEALAIRRQLLGEMNRDYALSLYNLGAQYQAVNQVHQAERCFLRARDIRMQILGEKHPDYAASLNNLAHLCQRTGDYARARPLLEQALDILERTLGDKHPNYASSLNNLASLYQDLGEYARARPLFERALVIRKQTLGDKHPDYAAGLNNLASLSNAMGDYPRAKLMFERALDVLKGSVGDKHPNYAGSLINLASLSKDLGEYARARPLYERALDIYRQTFGEKHPLYATSLNNLASLYQAMGDYASARRLYEQALDIRKQSLGEKHPGYAASLNNLAHLCQRTGDYARARPLFEQALDILERTLGDKHPSYAASLINLASLYKDLGDYARARPLFERVLEIRKQSLGDMHPKYADSLSQLAGLYQDMGIYARAQPLFEQARDILEQRLGDKHPEYAASLNRLGLHYMDMGYYSRARPLLESARDISRQSLGDKHPKYATCLTSLALLYQAMGDHGRARPLFELARDIDKQTLGDKHPNHAASLNNLASLYQAMGDHARARPLLEQALDIHQQTFGAKHPDYASSLNNLALLFKEMGDHARARPLFERALDIRKQSLGDKHPKYATSLDHLALLYQAMGDDARAQLLVERALDIRKQSFGDKHPQYATSLNNLAALRQHTWDYAQARRLFEEALGIYKETLGDAHPEYATGLNNLALLFMDLGDHTRARPLFERALDIRKQSLGDRHPHYATSLNNLAMFLHAQGRPLQAETLAYQAVSVYRQHLDDTFSALSERQRLDLSLRFHSKLNNYLVIALAAGAKAKQCYDLVLAWKGAVAARQAEERLARDRPDLAPLLEDLRVARAELARLAARPPAPAERRDWLDRFRRLENDKEKAQVKLAGLSQAFRLQHQVNTDQVRQALPRDAALVEFLTYTHFPPYKGKRLFPTEERLLAFVLRRDREAVCLELGALAPIEKAVQAWRAAVTASRDPGRDADLLRQRLWLPLEEHLGGAATVLLAPDGVLCELPFAALPGRVKGSYLLEDVALVHLTSGRQLPLMQAEAAAPAAPGLLVLGGLDYGKRPGPPPPGPLLGARAQLWAELAGTGQEARAVHALYRARFAAGRPPLLLSGAEAGAARLRKELAAGPKAGRWRYLHLATHGFFDPPPPAPPGRRLHGDGLLLGVHERYTYGRNPLLSCGLVLSGANRDAEGGSLTAEEVVSLDLRGARLVVLSACDTGLGKRHGWEAVQGLQHAFHTAGAQSLVVSLWQVPDVPTLVLMEEMYDRLWRTKGALAPHEALRQAQLAVHRDPDKVRKRWDALRAELVKRGLPEQELARRGFSRELRPLPGGGAVAELKRSPPLWWAGFVASGGAGTERR